MRLLFDRDLTPHPQYAAFYKWLQQEYKADAVVHFGMHGTVEWLPGAPLGKSLLCQNQVCTLQSDSPSFIRKHCKTQQIKVSQIFDLSLSQ